MTRIFSRFNNYRKFEGEIEITKQARNNNSFTAFVMTLFFLFIPIAIFFSVGILMFLDRDLFFLFYALGLVYLFNFLFCYLKETGYCNLTNKSKEFLFDFCLVDSLIKSVFFFLLIIIYYVSGVNIL
ncbi:MAG: hypothetical protein FWE36_02690 [Erysipelotrichales bacterium]|nr:hypothetical protein [Erysipelotrichales bacterium]